ncbi:MAG: carbon storage regulator CsrA [bacterium]
MLVLSRKKNETIIIDDQITVTIVEIRGDKVKLGIEAPPTVSVDRREVWEAKRRNAPNPTNPISNDRASF